MIKKRIKISLNDFALLFLTLGILAFPDIQIICLGSQIFALGIIVCNLLTGNIMMKQETVKYSIWALVFWGYCLVSCLWTIPTNITAIRCTISVLQCCLVGFMILYFANTKKKLQYLTNLFIVAGVILSIRFFIQVPSSVWGKEIRFENDPLFESNSTAVFLAYASALIVYFYVFNKQKMSKQFFSIFLVFVFMFVSLMTGTKKGILIFGIIVLSTFVLKSQNPLKLIFRIGISVFLVFVAFYIIMHVDLLYGAIGYRFERMIYQILGVNGIVDGSTRERVAFIKSAVHVFKENPIVGVGIDGFRYLNEIQHTYSHNNFTELLANLGIIGFAIYYSEYFGIVVKSKYFIKNNQIVFAMALAMIIADYGSVTYSSELQFILLGYLCASLTVIRSEKNEESRIMYNI